MNDMIDSILEQYEYIDLGKVKKTNRFERIDTKYVTHIDFLPFLLDKLKEDYLILSVKGELIPPYFTTYFDDRRLSMYHEHHNRKSNRFKIRQRKYITNNDEYLEIKFKSNKKKTIKKRVNVFDVTYEDIREFVAENTKYNIDSIEENVRTKYDRITLYSKDFTEKITIDLNLTFEKGSMTHKLSQIIIIEVKEDKDNNRSFISQLLKRRGVYKTGFSKYCMANVILNENIRKNRFKNNLLLIEKIKRNGISVKRIKCHKPDGSKVTY